VLYICRNELEDVTEKLQQVELEAEDMRGEMSTKIAALQAAVDDQGAAAAHEANQQVATLREELEAAASAMKVKDAVCADQAKSLQQAKEEAKKADEVSERRLSELEERTNSLEQEQELTADLRSQLLGKEQAMEEMEEECDRRRAQADEDEKMLEQYAAAVREKDEMLSFIDQEVEDLKAMFNEKEQGLLDQLTKQSAERNDAMDRLDAVEAEKTQHGEAAAQHEANMARLVRDKTATS
jgi:chromosome segregation ATPase